MTDTGKHTPQMEIVPDLYRLAFMPGQFRCPECGFQWSIQTINVALGQIGTTEENRQTPDCPNDGTRMVNVTYREQLEAYGDRLKEELDNRDRLVKALRMARQHMVGLAAYLATCATDVILENLETTITGLHKQTEQLEAAIQKATVSVETKPEGE